MTDADCKRQKRVKIFGIFSFLLYICTLVEKCAPNEELGMRSEELGMANKLLDA